MAGFVEAPIPVAARYGPEPDDLTIIENDSDEEEVENDGVEENATVSSRQSQNMTKEQLREEECHAVAEVVLQGSQMRIECAKVCAPAMMAELVEGSHSALTRLRGVKSVVALHKLLPVFRAEYGSLLTQWQQRSGTIRVVVRVRPMVRQDAECDSAVRLLPGGIRNRGITATVKHCGRPADHHTFKRFDYILDSTKDQESVFLELQAMLPTAGPGGLSGPMQSACILAYGQTGSGKTHTMFGGDDVQRGLVPRVLSTVFELAAGSGATISLIAIEVYNDTAYDLLDGTRNEENSTGVARGFQAGHLPPPPGLNFRQGCANALGQATSVRVDSMEDATLVLAEAAERRSTRSTCFNATSSRSHSMVFVHAHLPSCSGNDPALRIAFVDLAGSERLPTAESGGMVAEESRHINLSLSSLGSVIHALRHKANHLPYRACLLTRLLEPFFEACGRVLLCVCVAPEQCYAQETLCSLNFANRASRAVLGADSASEVQRDQALAAVRETYAVTRNLIHELMPKMKIGKRSNQRLPDYVAQLILSYMRSYDNARFVCKAWCQMCPHLGQVLQHVPKVVAALLKFCVPMDVAGVCRCWWSSAEAYHVTIEASSAKVFQSHAGVSHSLWKLASASTRSQMWTALMRAGGASGEVGEKPLVNVRECIVTGSPQPEALKEVLLRCPELRVAEIPEAGLVSAACAGLVSCVKLRALKCSMSLVPNIVNIRSVFQKCRNLKVLALGGTSELPVSFRYLAEELPKSCGLRELTVARCVAGWTDILAVAKSCIHLRVLRLPDSFVEVGDSPTSPPPLIPLARLKYLRCIDFRAIDGRKFKQRPWLTDDMFAVLGQMKQLIDIRVTGQKLLSERCFWYLKRHGMSLRVLHLNGCKPMSGDIVFNFIHVCSKLESLRLPVLVIAQSGRKLGIGSTRWCSSLNSPRLNELCVESWASLEDAGVQMMIGQCSQIRTLWLRQAPRLSDDAVTYLAALPQLTSLSLSQNVGLTNRALNELASASRLRCLDLSGCRQLTEAGIVEFAASIGTAQGPPLRSIQLDSCPNMGRAAAEALASKAGLYRCSLSCCRPLPEAAISWKDFRTQVEACQALGIPAPPENSTRDFVEFGESPVDFEHTPQTSQRTETAQCAVCLDDILDGEAVWECPVCRNCLHDTEDCARGWLRMKQSCPTCRAAAWAPPEQPAALSPFRPLDLHAGRQPRRASSARAHSIRAPVAVRGMDRSSSDARREDGQFGISVSGISHARSVAIANPESGHGRADNIPNRRPPRPARSSNVTSANASRLSLALAATPAVLANTAITAPAPSRSRSLPPSRRQDVLSLAVAGLAIVGNSSMVAA